MRKSALVTMLAMFGMALFWSMSIYIPTVVASPESPEMLIYEIAPPPNVTPAYVADMAATFEIPSPTITDVDGTYYVANNSDLYMEVYKASGSIWYADWSKMYNEDYERDMSINSTTATSIAEDFLDNAGLDRPEALSIEVGNTTTVNFDETSETVTFTKQNSLDVIFGFYVQMNGSYYANVDGPGAKIRVSVGEQGDPIGVHWVWRELQSNFSATARTEQEALGILMHKFKAEFVNSNVQVQVTSTRLAYYAEPEDVNQAYLQPYYLFDGEVRIFVNDTYTEELSFQTVKIPATLFSPITIITEPWYGQRYEFNEFGEALVHFNSSVINGSPPYTYEWEWGWSDTTVIYGPSFYAVFACGNQIFGEEMKNEPELNFLVPETITLKVTDNDGNVATDYTSIIVCLKKEDITGADGAGWPDGRVDMRDIGVVCKAFGSYPGHSRWNFWADVYCDGKIDMRDIGAIAREFGWAGSKPLVSSYLHIPMVFPGFVVLWVPMAISTMHVKKKRGLVGFLLATIVVTSASITSLSSVNAQCGDGDDVYLREVGLESCGQNLAVYATASSNGFKDRLRTVGWDVEFHWREWAAWEQDFKYRNGLRGGTDYRWIDTVDFAYYVGHGSPYCITFSSSVDYQRFYFSRARWGGTSGGNTGEEADLEWIALESCKTLRYIAPNGQTVFQRWRQAFCGLHYVLGFHTVAQASYTLGRTFARFMTQGWWSGLTVRRAWIRATQQVQPSSVKGAYLRAGSPTANTYNDRIHPYPYLVLSQSDPCPPDRYFRYCSWQC